MERSINILFSENKRKVCWILEECEDIQDKDLVVYDPKTNTAMLSECHIGESGLIVRGVSMKTWKKLDAIPPVTNLMAELGLVFTNEEGLTEILMSLNFERDNDKERSERIEEEREEAIAQAEKWSAEEAKEEPENQKDLEETLSATKEGFQLSKSFLDSIETDGKLPQAFLHKVKAKIELITKLATDSGVTTEQIRVLMKETGLSKYFGVEEVEVDEDSSVSEKEEGLIQIKEVLEMMNKTLDTLKGKDETEYAVNCLMTAMTMDQVVSLAGKFGITPKEVNDLSDEVGLTKHFKR